MKPLQLIHITAIIALGSCVVAVPVENNSSFSNFGEGGPAGSAVNVEIVPNETVTKPAEIADSINKDKLDTSSSNRESSYVLPSSPSGAAAPAFDPSIYAGFLTPEAFQQYLAQFAGAFAPYGYPGYAPAPAPVYPGPYAVQTGYDGFLVPSATASTSLSASGSVPSIVNNLVTALQNIYTNLMDSMIFRVIMTALSALAMVLFGGALTTAICNLTPLCDISFKAVTYLRGKSGVNMGRMIAEEMTPERVRRAAEFVRNAIRKYQEMQNMMTAKNYEQETDELYDQQDD